MSEGKAFALLVAGVLVGLFLLVGACETIQYLYERNIQCPSFASNIERPYKYSWFAGGCFVQTTTGQWVADKNYWNNPVLSK